LTPTAQDDARLERRIARLLTIGTYAAVVLLTIGVVALLASGRSPLDGGPRLDPARVAADLAALRPEGFLWLGLLAVIATPAARVGASLVGYLARREVGMAVISALILGIIVVSVVLATVSEG
jgi:uncharacterized membrane protein